MSRNILLFLQLITLICCVISKSVYSNEKYETIVKLPNQGSLKGLVNQTVWTKQNYIQFLGIPYAESPTKNLRFKAPVPKGKWYDIKDVTKYGRRCPTLELINGLTTEELKEDLEDCLNLSVFTKNLTAKRPVLFYIHGGGFNNGGSYKIPGGFLMEKDIVMVVPQYRLGHFGFLSTKTEEMPGNMAVLDLILSLKWVHDNIEYFGGDPNNVTIAGQSAGSYLVNALVLSPAVPKGLFKRGIMASGAIINSMAVSKDYYQTSQYVCKQICRACRNVREINQCFMDVPVRTILETKVSNNPLGLLALTINDYYGILPEAPEILAKKNLNKYPVMASVSKQDGAGIFAGMYLQMITKNLNVKEFSKMFLSVFGNKNMTNDEFKSLMNYVFTPEQQNEKNLTKVFPGLVDFASIVTFKKPTLDFIKMNSMNTTNENYLSTFDYRGEHTKFKIPHLSEVYPFKNGVHHADEIFLLFNTQQLNAKDTEAAKLMIDIWTSFVITGRPSVANGPKLMPVTAKSTPYFHINSEITTGDDFENELLVTVRDSQKLINTKF